MTETSNVCFSCGKKLTKTNGWCDGYVEMQGEPGYGSVHDGINQRDLVTEYRLHVCDDCWRDNRHRLVGVIKTTRVETRTHTLTPFGAERMFRETRTRTLTHVGAEHASQRDEPLDEEAVKEEEHFGLTDTSTRDAVEEGKEHARLARMGKAAEWLFEQGYMVTRTEYSWGVCSNRQVRVQVINHDQVFWSGMSDELENALLDAYYKETGEDLRVYKEET